MKGKYLLLLCVFVLTSVLGFSQKKLRVISLTPSITENIYLLDAQDLLVGCTSYCTRAVADGKDIVGSTIDVNIEKVLSLNPDIVLTMELKKPQDIAALKKLGINLVILKSPNNFETICKQTQQIAELLGVPEKGKRVVEKAQHEVQIIRQKVNHSAPKLNVFFQIGANPIFSVLDNTFMNEYIEICNGKNIAAGLKHGTVTRESVLIKNPDVIIIASMGGFGENEVKTWKNFTSIKAIKNNKIFLVPSETSCSPTPHNFVLALNDIYSNIYQK